MGSPQEQTENLGLSLHSRLSSDNWATYLVLSRPVKDPRTVLLFHDILTTSQNIKQFKENIFEKLNSDEVEKYTRDQSKNGHWFKAREHVLTASTIYHLLNALKRENFEIKKHFYKIRKINMKPLFYPAILWGQLSERIALKQYYEMENGNHDNLIISNCGLVHSSKNPMLAMSPDGIQHCNCHGKVLLEVKSPHSIRHSTVAEMGGNLRYLTKKLTLKKNTPEFYQIQMGLYCTRIKSAKLIIYTKCDIFTIDIRPDIGIFHKFESILPKFYYDVYLRHYFNTICK